MVHSTLSCYHSSSPLFGVIFAFISQHKLTLLWRKPFCHQSGFRMTVKRRSERDLKYSWYLDLVLSQTMGCWTRISLICLCLSTSLQTPTVYQPASTHQLVLWLRIKINFYKYFCIPFVCFHISLDGDVKKQIWQNVCVQPTWCSVSVALFLKAFSVPECLRKGIFAASLFETVDR